MAKHVDWIDQCYKMLKCLIQVAFYANIIYRDFHNRIEIKSKLNLGRAIACHMQTSWFTLKHHQKLKNMNRYSICTKVKTLSYNLICIHSDII